MVQVDMFQILESTKENFGTENFMEKDHLLMLTIENILEIGKMGLFKVEGYLLGLMEINMMGNT